MSTSDTHPILVLGGTGTIGARLVACLRAQGHAVRPAARSTEPRFDWSDPAT